MNDDPHAFRRVAGRAAALALKGLFAAISLVALVSCGLEPTPKKPPAPTHVFGIELSSASSQITEPLLTNGTPDYAAAINAATGLGVNFENNAVQGLAPVLGMSLSKTISERLNVASEPPPREKRFVGGLSKELFEEYYRSRIENAPTEEVAAAVEAFQAELEVLDRGYCSSAACPQIAAWLRANEGPLATVAEASRKPRFWVPLEDGENLHRSPTFAVDGFRRACDALGARASLRLGDEDWTGASSDLVTAERLGGLLGQSTLMTAQSIAAGCIGEGNEALRRAATDPALDVAAAKSLLSELQDLPQIGNFELVLQQERFVALAGIFLMREVAAHDGGSAWSAILEGREAIEPRPQGLYRLEVSSIDWNEAVGLVNRSWDLAREVTWSATEATGAEVRKRFQEALRFRSETRSTLEEPQLSKLLERVARDPEARASLTRAFVDAAGLLPMDITGFVRSIHEPLAERELGLLTLALTAYRKEAGKLPDSLETLVPAYLDRIPPATQLGHVLRVHRGDSGELALTLVPQELHVTGSRAYCIDTEGRNRVLPDGLEPKVIEGRCPDPPPDASPEPALDVDVDGGAVR